KTPEAAEASGRALGRLYLRLDAKRRNLARKNLACAFPALPPAEIDALAIRVIAHPLDNPLLDATLTRLRTSTGNSVIEKRAAAREMLHALRRGGAIGVLN